MSQTLKQYCLVKRLHQGHSIIFFLMLDIAGKQIKINRNRGKLIMNMWIKKKSKDCTVGLKIEGGKGLSSSF